LKKVSTSLVVVLFVCSTFSIFAPQVKAEGIYTDFESGFDGWEPFSQTGSTSHALVQRSTAYAHSGTYSVEQSCQSSGTDSGAMSRIRLPVASSLDQYELSTWVYVTERSDANAASLFGFVYGSEFVSWNPWGSGSSYVYVRQSEGYLPKGDWYNPVPYGLTLNTWHQVKVAVYTNLGTVSIWLDDSLIMDNWPAFNAGEKPDYYDIRCSANYYGAYVMHQYIDDVYVSEVARAFPWRDDFNYNTLNEMKSAGWNLVGEHLIQVVGDGTVTMTNDGVSGSGVSYVGKFPSGIYDFVAETSAKRVDTSMGGIGIDIYTEKHVYSAGAEAWTSEYRLIRDGAMLLAVGGYTSKQNVWEKIELERVGNEFHLYIDDQLQLTFVETDDLPSPIIGVGIRAGWLVTMKYDYISVSTPSGGNQKPIAVLDVDPDPLSPNQGFTVEICVSNITDLYTWDIGLEWDPAVLNCTDFREGPFLQTGGGTLMIVGTINNAAGRIFPPYGCTLLDATVGVNGNGTLAYADFHVKDYGETWINFTAETSLIDSVGEHIPADLQPGYFRTPPQPPVALLNLWPSIAFEGETFTFNGSLSEHGWNGTDVVPIDWYYFDFGDGSPTQNSSSPTALHAYSTQGCYPANLTVHAPVNKLGVPNTGTDIREVLVLPTFHDVAITDVRSTTIFAYAGENLSIYVDTWNRGAFPETFNVTTHADENTTVIGDEITIGTQSLTLPSQGLTNLTFTWNTTGVPPGNYTISAVASNVTQEADPNDNLYVNGKIGVFASIPCYDINITHPTHVELNPSIFQFNQTVRALEVSLGNMTINSTGYEGLLRVLGSTNGTIHVRVDQPNLEFAEYYLPQSGSIKVPLWLLFDPGTYFGTYELQLTVCGTYRLKVTVNIISIWVCSNGAYLVRGGTATFNWPVTGSLVYLEAEPNLPPGWSFTVDPPIGTLFETPHQIIVNITAAPDAQEGDIGSVTVRAYRNGTDILVWQYTFFASVDNRPPTIETIQAPTLTFTGDLRFNVTVKDASGIESVQLHYSVDDGPWNNQTMQWNSGDTFNSTSYTLAIPHVPDNSTIDYYIVATDWLRNQTQSDIQTITVKYDLAITEVETGETEVVRRSTAQINVTVANQGTIPGTSLKITVYANTTPIHTQTIPFLANGTATTLTSPWNTTAFAEGNYSISASAWPLPGETDTADNAHIDGYVAVKPVVAITNISTTLQYNASAVYSDDPACRWRVNVTVLVLNQGTETENFTLTAHYANRTVDTLAVTQLGPGAYTTQALTWNLTGVAPCPYKFITNESDPQYPGYYIPYAVTVNVSSPSLGETTRDAGTVIVRLPGDGNGNGWATGSDLAILGRAWYKSYGQVGYDWRADWSGDGWCTGSDLAILGRNWYKRAQPA